MILRYIVINVIISLLLIFAGYYLICPTLPQYCFNPFFWLVIYFFLLNLSAKLFIQKKYRKSQSLFIKNYMAATAIKFLIHIAVLFAFIINYRNSAKIFAVWFFIFYVIYTFADIFFMIKFVKRAEQ